MFKRTDGAEQEWEDALGVPGTQSPILKTTITLEKLRLRGYESMLDYYQRLQPEIQ